MRTIAVATAMAIMMTRAVPTRTRQEEREEEKDEQYEEQRDGHYDHRDDW